MFTQNLHAHSTFDDGKSTLEEMILASKAAGLESVGLSVHSPLPYGSSWACPKERMGAYAAQVRRLQEKYAGQIDVFLGIEWDVLSEGIDLSAFDYAIASVHHIPRPMRLPPDCPQALAAMFGTDYPSVDESAQATRRCLDGHFAGDADAMAQAYFAEFDRACAQEQAKIVGHFDLLTKFDEQERFFLPPTRRYMDAALCAMEKLVRAGKIFEVNTGAISRGYRSEPYPARALLCALREMGGGVTLSADAHHVSGVACAFAQAERIVRECGFDRVWRLVREDGRAVFAEEEWR